MPGGPGKLRAGQTRRIIAICSSPRQDKVWHKAFLEQITEGLWSINSSNVYYISQIKDYILYDVDILPSGFNKTEFNKYLLDVIDFKYYCFYFETN